MNIATWFFFVIPLYCVALLLRDVRGASRRPARPTPPPLRPATPAELEFKKCFDEAMLELDTSDRLILYGILSDHEKRGCEMNSLQVLEAWRDLAAHLEEMDVPAERLTDLRWLARNLCVKNNENKHFLPAMDIIKKLLRDIDREIKRMG